MINFIGKLENLTMLSLRENRLAELPLEIGNLSSLHVMDVSGRWLLLVTYKQGGVIGDIRVIRNILIFG